ncbi:MAG: NADP-dependent oxidoreductase [Chloroflexi bacterium]|nr:NADP-dependent oxidoreductase [Chloroflexota bacterium]
MAQQTMRAIRLHKYAQAQELVLENIPRPEKPGEGQALVRVHAAGVNPIDTALRAGYMQNLIPISFPATLGIEMAGVVEEVGPGVTNLKKGQAVYGNLLYDIGRGSYAEYMLANANTIVPMPKNLDYDHAATVLHGARTAWSGLFELGDLQAGQRVLIHGAAGGVGIYAVQLAHWKGAYVIATTSTQNVEFVRSLGADEVIDYTKTKFEHTVHDVDLVFDGVGGETLEESWHTLKRGGMLVSTIGTPSEEKAAQHGVRCAQVGFPKDLANILSQVTALVEAGKLKPFVRKVYTMDEAVHAHLHSETRRGRGRIVLRIAQSD